MSVNKRAKLVNDATVGAYRLEEEDFTGGTEIIDGIIFLTKAGTWHKYGLFRNDATGEFIKVFEDGFTRGGYYANWRSYNQLSRYERNIISDKVRNGELVS